MRYKQWFLTGFLVTSCFGGANEILPFPAAGYEIPAGAPSGAIGGVGLPALSKGLVGRSPAISAASEMTRPGETLVASGYGLEGAALRLWAEGGMHRITPLFAHNDRLAALLPEVLPQSMYLVWPEKEGQFGEPIRINAATAWWTWPRELPANEASRELYLVGKSLELPGIKPVVFLQGQGVSKTLEITESNPYKLTLQVPALPAGEYRIWAHNGTGGQYGWSEPIPLTVKPKLAEIGTAEVHVNDFGASPDNGVDDAPAIQRALEALARQGGGTLKFGEGRYLIGSGITIATPGIRLAGVGMGDFEMIGEKTAGVHTTLAVADNVALPFLLRIEAPGAIVEGMTLINGHSGRDENAIVVTARDVILREIRVVFPDRRDWGYSRRGPWGEPGERRRDGPYEKGLIDDGAVFVDTEGYASFLFENAEVHAAGPGIQVGRFSGWDTMIGQPPSKSVWVRNVDFRGHYAGEPDGNSNPGASGRATGVVVYTGREIAVENSTFRGVDRQNRRIMGRTVLVFNSSSRDLYFAGNESINTGPHPSAIGMDSNQGEQYLIHYRYPYGGIFDVLSSDLDQLTVNTANIEPFPATRDRSTRWDMRMPHFHFNSQGSRVLDEVREDGNWILFVSAGKGAGQFREIKDFERKDGAVTFSLSEPWRVIPDASSRVNLMPAYRRVVIYDNFVDTGELIETHKTHGVTFWFDSFDNVVEGNTFRNLTSGIIFNSRFRGPTGWNTTRDNVVENIYGYPGDTSEKAAGYVDHTRVVVQWPEPRDRVWYQVGNVARNNTIRNAEVGAYLHTRYTGLVRQNKPEPVAHPDGGIVLSVIEGNVLEAVREGIVVSSPVNAAVVRSNKIDASALIAPAIYSQDNPATVLDSVHFDNYSNGRAITELVTWSPRISAQRNDASRAAPQNPEDLEPIPPAEGRRRIVIQQGLVETPSGPADPATRAPAATLRSSRPDEVYRSATLLIGTDEAGRDVENNRGVFGFDLEPLRDYLSREGGQIERVYFVLTTASPNPDFSGRSTFHAHLTAPFEETLATWSNPGPRSVSGGTMGERLSGSVVTHAHASMVGANVIFSGPAWADAVRQALGQRERYVFFLVKRGAESDTRMSHYWFSPANNNHMQSDGSLDWRPALIVDLVDNQK